MAKHLLRFGALGYLAVLLLAPVVMITYRTFEHGLEPVLSALSTPLNTLKLAAPVEPQMCGE